MTVSALGLLLVVGSALAYSGLDLVRKLLVGAIGAVPLLFYLSVGQLPFFAGWALVAEAGPIGSTYYLPAAVSVALNIVANLAFLEAVRISPLSLTVPFLSLSPAFASLLGVPLLGERPSPLEWMGVLVVVYGALLLNSPRGRERGLGVLWRAFVSERGSLLMVVVALCWSLAMPLDKIALSAAHASVHGLVLNGGVALGMLAVLVGQRRTASLRNVRRGVALTAVGIVVSVLGLALFLLALSELWVALAETLRRAIGSTAALLVGRHFFGESLTVGKVAAVALMSLGVALILF